MKQVKLRRGQGKKRHEEEVYLHYLAVIGRGGKKIKEFKYQESIFYRLYFFDKSKDWEIYNRKLEFYSCKFKRWGFNELTQCHFYKTTFEKCVFTDTVATDLIDCEFESCSFRSGDFRGSDFRNCKFKNCNLDYVRSARFINCTFEDCSLEAHGMKPSVFL